MKKSIGGKVISLIAILGGVFLVAIVANILALTSIKENNNKMNIYLEMSKEKNTVSVAFQQMQLYSNLSYFKEGTDELGTVQEKLRTGISDVSTGMANLSNLCQYTDDAEVVAAYEEWKANLNNFSDYAADILAGSECGILRQ